MKKLIVLSLLLLLTSCKQEFEITTSLQPGYDIISLNETWVDEGCYLLISEEGHFVMGYDTGSVDSTVLGEYEITYKKVYGEVEYYCKRIVKVIDDISPTVTLNPGIDTIKQGTTWVDALATVSDNNGGVITIEILGRVDINTIGSYEITYLVKDQSGNETTIIRIVNVIE